MTHRLDVAYSRALSARWCALAERRLEHLTELFESGRWRRYYSEHAFLENIQEAKFAVKNWRALSLGEPITPRTGFVLTVADGETMLEPAGPGADEGEMTLDELISLVPSLETVIAGSDIVMPETLTLADLAQSSPRVDMAALEEALNVGADVGMASPVLSLDAIERRYPALRHVL
jgi:uncharacterized repeat protein (TIGR03809 family)